MIDVSVDINAPRDKVWQKWTNIDDVKNWSFASDDWAAEGLENNLTVGGRFRARNYAKDGSAEFILEWTYDTIKEGQFLAYTMDDGRKVQVTFSDTEQGTRIRQSFEPEQENSEDMQRNGWQAYLDNFKKFVESD